MNPLVQFLRPVSPLAWFPIRLIIFVNAEGGGVGDLHHAPLADRAQHRGRRRLGAHDHTTWPRCSASADGVRSVMS